MNLKNFSLWLAFILSEAIAGYIFFFHTPRSFLAALCCFSGSALSLWPLALWLIRKIIRRMKPLSMIDKYGTMLYPIKNGIFDFAGCVDLEPLEEITVSQLGREHIGLPVVMEMDEEKVFHLDVANSGTSIMLTLKVKGLIFRFNGSSNKNMAMQLLYFYGNRQRANQRLRETIKRAMKETYEALVLR